MARDRNRWSPDNKPEATPERPPEPDGIELAYRQMKLAEAAVDSVAKRTNGENEAMVLKMRLDLADRYIALAEIEAEYAGMAGDPLDD